MYSSIYLTTAKIAQFARVIGANDNIRRLQIEMDQQSFVEKIQRLWYVQGKPAR